MIQYGGYILHPSDEETKMIIVATGSEVRLAIEIANEFNDICVFSMPCLELFNQQKDDYKNILYNSNAAIFSIEASTNKDFFSFTDHSYGVQDFGHSSPASDLEKHFKFTKEDIIKEIENYL